jgi:hypothetical protein
MTMHAAMQPSPRRTRPPLRNRTMKETDEKGGGDAAAEGAIVENANLMPAWQPIHPPRRQWTWCLTPMQRPSSRRAPRLWPICIHRRFSLNALRMSPQVRSPTHRPDRRRNQQSRACQRRLLPSQSAEARRCASRRLRRSLIKRAKARPRSPRLPLRQSLCSPARRRVKRVTVRAALAGGVSASWEGIELRQ